MVLGLAFDPELLFDGYRHTMQRPSEFAFLRFLITGFGGGQGFLPKQVKDRVYLIIVLFDLVQVFQDDGCTGGFTFPDQVCQFGGGFVDVLFHANDYVYFPLNLAR